MKVEMVIGVAACFLFGGCMRNDVPAEIEEAIQALQDAYMSNDRDVVQAAPKKFGELDGKISSIEDPQVRRASYWRCIDKILSINPEKIDLAYRGLYLCDVVKSGLLSLADSMECKGASKEESWEARFRLLSYVRKHIRKLRASIRMPKGVERRGTGFDVKDAGAFERYMETVEGFNYAAGEYEMHVRMMEADSFCRDIRDLPVDMKTRLQKRFEDFLGRPMRTLEQCRRDHKNKTATEFPFLSLSEM